MNIAEEVLNKQIEELRESIDQLDSECDNLYLQQQRCDFEKDYVNQYLKTKENFKKNMFLSCFDVIVTLFSLSCFLGEVYLGGELLYMLTSILNTVLFSVFTAKSIIKAGNDKKDMNQFHMNFPDLLDDDINIKLIEIDGNRKKACSQIAEKLKKSVELEDKLEFVYNQLRVFREEHGTVGTEIAGDTQLGIDYFNDFINEKVNYSGIHLDRKIGNEIVYTEESIKKLRKTI